MRVFGIALIVSLTIALADQPPRPLTPQEIKTLRLQITVGRHIVDALERYSKTSYETNGESANMWTWGISELGLLTRTPTIEVLHAVGYISDADLTLAQRYRATPVPAPANQALATRLAMQTDRGELLFDTRGEITFH